MRVGIHVGPETVGNFGSSLRSDYSVMGPTVNLASRIESSTNPWEILVSQVVMGYLEDGSWEKARVYSLKGAETETVLYRIGPIIA